MAVESGKTGKMMIGSSDIAEVKNWKFTKSANNKNYASSSTAGYQKSVAGVFSGSVSFEVILKQGDAIEVRMKPGDQVTLLLYRNATKYFSIPCRIESMDDSVNIEEGEPPSVSVEASTYGAWSYPA